MMAGSIVTPDQKPALLPSHVVKQASSHHPVKCKYKDKSQKKKNRSWKWQVIQGSIFYKTLCTTSMYKILLYMLEKYWSCFCEDITSNFCFCFNIKGNKLQKFLHHILSFHFNNIKIGHLKASVNYILPNSSFKYCNNITVSESNAGRYKVMSPSHCKYNCLPECLICEDFFRKNSNKVSDSKQTRRKRRNLIDQETFVTISTVNCHMPNISQNEGYSNELDWKEVEQSCSKSWRTFLITPDTAYSKNISCKKRKLVASSVERTDLLSSEHVESASNSASKILNIKSDVSHSREPVQTSQLPCVPPKDPRLYARENSKQNRDICLKRVKWDFCHNKTSSSNGYSSSINSAPKEQVRPILLNGYSLLDPRLTRGAAAKFFPIVHKSNSSTGYVQPERNSPLMLTITKNESLCKDSMPIKYVSACSVKNDEYKGESKENGNLFDIIPPEPKTRKDLIEHCNLENRASMKSDHLKDETVFKGKLRHDSVFMSSKEADVRKNCCNLLSDFYKELSVDSKEIKYLDEFSNGENKLCSFDMLKKSKFIIDDAEAECDFKKKRVHNVNALLISKSVTSKNESVVLERQVAEKTEVASVKEIIVPNLKNVSKNFVSDDSLTSNDLLNLNLEHTNACELQEMSKLSCNSVGIHDTYEKLDDSVDFDITYKHPIIVTDKQKTQSNQIHDTYEKLDDSVDFDITYKHPIIATDKQKTQTNQMRTLSRIEGTFVNCDFKKKCVQNVNSLLVSKSVTSKNKSMVPEQQIVKNTEITSSKIAVVPNLENVSKNEYASDISDDLLNSSDLLKLNVKHISACESELQGMSKLSCSNSLGIHDTHEKSGDPVDIAISNNHPIIATDKQNTQTNEIQNLSGIEDIFLNCDSGDLDVSYASVNALDLDEQIVYVDKKLESVSQLENYKPNSVSQNSFLNLATPKNVQTDAIAEDFPVVESGTTLTANEITQSSKVKLSVITSVSQNSNVLENVPTFTTVQSSTNSDSENINIKFSGLNANKNIEIFKSDCNDIYFPEKLASEENKNIVLDVDLFKENEALYCYYKHLNGMGFHKLDLTRITKDTTMLDSESLKSFNVLRDQLHYHESVLRGLVHQASEPGTDSRLELAQKITEELKYIEGYEVACSVMFL